MLLIDNTSYLTGRQDLGIVNTQHGPSFAWIDSHSGLLSSSNSGRSGGMCVHRLQLCSASPTDVKHTCNCVATISFVLTFFLCHHHSPRVIGGHSMDLQRVV